IEQRFVFDVRRGIDPQDKRAVERDIEITKSKLEQELRSGFAALRQLSEQTRSSHEYLIKSADTAVNNLVQAEVDVSAIAALPYLISFGAVLTIALWALVFVKGDFSGI